MDREKLREEAASYSDEDLELILETQKDLYEPEELALLGEELQKRQDKRQERILARLPKKIVCPKCDGMNPFENDVCQFCASPLDKRKYYREDW